MEKEINVIGFYALSNFGGIEVLEINHDEDTVVWRYKFGESQKINESEIEYGEEVSGFYADGTLVDFGSIIKVV